MSAFRLLKTCCATHKYHNILSARTKYELDTLHRCLNQHGPLPIDAQLSSKRPHYCKTYLCILLTFPLPVVAIQPNNKRFKNKLSIHHLSIPFSSLYWYLIDNSSTIKKCWLEFPLVLNTWQLSVCDNQPNTPRLTSHSKLVLYIFGNHVRLETGLYL